MRVREPKESDDAHEAQGWRLVSASTRTQSLFLWWRHQGAPGQEGACTQFEDESMTLLCFVPGLLSEQEIQSVATMYGIGYQRGASDKAEAIRAALGVTS